MKVKALHLYHLGHSETQQTTTTLPRHYPGGQQKLLRLLVWKRGIRMFFMEQLHNHRHERERRPTFCAEHTSSIAHPLLLHQRRLQQQHLPLFQPLTYYCYNLFPYHNHT
jgi:hypothetical protein